jgi:hypothetical protein
MMDTRLTTMCSTARAFIAGIDTKAEDLDARQGYLTGIPLFA